MSNPAQKDITEKKKITKTEKTPKKYELPVILKTSLDGVFIVDKNKKISYANSATANIYGYRSAKGLIGKSWKILYEKNEIKRFDSKIIPDLISVGSWHGEVTGVKHNGNKFFQEISLSLTEDGSIITITRDISRRKNYEISLKESESRYRSLIDNLQEGVFYVDNNGIMIYANRRCCEIFGFSLSELIGTNSYELLYDKDDIEFVVKKNRLREQGISDKYELKCKNKDGELIWCNVNGTPYYDINGSVIGSITIITDITEQKKYTEALKESEIKFQTIFMLSVDAIGVSKGGVTILVNPAFVSLFGYESYDEIMGKQESSLIAPGERKRVMEYTKKRAQREHAPASYISKGLKKDGTEFVLEVHVSSYEFGDEMYNIAIMRDITELERAQKALKESEENYRSLVNTSPDAIVVTDMNNKLNLVNQSALDIFGYSDSKKLIGKKYFDYISKNDLEKLDYISRDILEKGFVRNVEFEMLKEDKTSFPSDMSASVIRDFEGKPKGIVSIFGDITKRKQDEEQLRKYADEQAALNATKDKFYSVIAHDLKSPFQTILGYSEMLRSNIDNLNTDKIFGYADNIHKATTETYRLLEDLLQWTGSQTGRIKVTPEIIYVIEMFYSVTKTYKDAAKNKEIVLYSNVIEDLYINSDRNMITAILRNLVSNAIKFTKRQGQIVLDAQEDENSIIISVTDNGIGIPKENISKLFRIDSTYSTKGTEKEKGTGLGLIICKEFAEKNNGKLIVESEVGKGSKFILSLPKMTH
jgi:PAS domain S-box-containing protein